MRLWWLIGLSVVFLAAIAQAASVEIPLEGSWNKPGVGGMPCLGWRINPYFDNGEAKLVSPGKSFERSLTLSCRDKTKNLIIYSKQVFKGTTGESFDLSLAVKGNAKWAIGFCGFDKGGNKIGWQAVESLSPFIRTASDQWQDHQLRITIARPKDPARKVISLRLMVSVGGPGAIQLDDFKLAREVTNVPAAGISMSKRTLINGATEISFGDKASGFTCAGIRGAHGARFVDGQTPLWRIELRKPTAEGAANNQIITAATSARDMKFALLPAEGGKQSAELTWEGVDLPDEKGVVDVRARVILDADGESRWLIDVTNRSHEYGIWKVVYPCFGEVSAPGTADVIFPTGMFGGSLRKHSADGHYFFYPSAGMSVQFTAFMKNGNGLYIAAEDAGGAVKGLRITQSQEVSFEHYPQEMAKPGNRFKSSYPVVLRLFQGDWWTAAKIYRVWAIAHHLAGSEDRLVNREIPWTYKETSVVMQMWQSPRAVARFTSAACNEFGASPLAFWCEWGAYPFDSHLPDIFPARAGMSQSVAAMSKAGITVMPYLNIRLWSHDQPRYNSETVQQAFTRTLDGKTSDEFTGSVLCPGTDLAQKTWRNICQKLIEGQGVNALYLDQIMAAAPKFCFTPGHSHPAGGATTWAPNYREVIRNIRADAERLNRPVALVSEAFTDAYVRELDGGLICWWEPYQFENAIPLVPAVYSGYTLLLPNADNAAVQSLDAYVMMQGRYFLWGIPPSVHQKEYETKTASGQIACVKPKAARQFIVDAARTRHAAGAFMIYGELVGELTPTKAIPSLAADWKFRRGGKTLEKPMIYPAVRATLWRDANGKLGVALVNFSSSPQHVSYIVDPAAHGASGGRASVKQNLPARSTHFVTLP